MRLRRDKGRRKDVGKECEAAGPPGAWRAAVVVGRLLLVLRRPEGCSRAKAAPSKARGGPAPRPQSMTPAQSALYD
jgi:hypothetical protein